MIFHVVFVTKFRKKCLTQKILQELYEFLPRYTESLGLSIEKIQGEEDHLHFLLEMSPKDRLSNIIGTIKCSSSSFLYKNGHKFPYFGKLSKTIWSSGYFVCSTGGVSIDILKKYIENQG